MSKPDYPRFADTVENNTALVEEPSSGRKDVGWVQEMPPFQIFNWLLVKIYRWIKWIEAKLERPEAFIMKSAGTLAWSGSAITFASAIALHFRNTAGALYINQIAAGGSPINLSDGQVVVARLDRTNASPVTLTLQGTYASLAAGQYSIVAEASLTLTNEQDETILFRRAGSTLEIPVLGLIYPSGSTITLGQSYPSAHVHPTSDITSGTFADARIAQSNVTQHQAALTILETQITDGSLLARVGSNETITGQWAAPVTDPPGARQIVAQGGAKMWMWLNSNGTSQTDFNVASSSKTGTGAYSISIDTDLSGVDGVVQAKWSIGKSGTDGVPTVTTSNNASTILVTTYIADLSAGTITETDGNPYIVLFGNQ